MLALTGCFTGENALGLPCENDDQCGTKLRCEMGFCGGPPPGESGTTASSTTATDTTTATATATTTSTDTSATTSGSSSEDTGPMPTCSAPPDPGVCRGMPIGRTLESVELMVANGQRMSAAVAGEYVAGGLADIALLDFAAQQVRLLRNDGDDLWVTDVGVQPFTNEPLDFVQTDLDCDGDPDFVAAGQLGGLEWAEWDGQGFSNDTISLDSGTFSMTVADLLDDPDGYPDVAVSLGGQADRVQLFRNTGGLLAFEAELTMVASDSPWDTLVVDTPGGPRILVANADDTDLVDEPPADEPVTVLRVVDGAPAELQLDNVLSPVAGDFQNPFALAAGDFDGDGLLEVAVAEKRVTTEDPQESSDLMGSVRVFELDDGFTQTAGFAVGIGPAAMAAADLDCDGVHDLVVTGDGSWSTPGADGRVDVIWGGPDFATASPVVVPGLDDLQSGGRLAVGDFDGNGAPEVVVPDFGDPTGMPPGRSVIVRAGG